MDQQKVTQRQKARELVKQYVRYGVISCLVVVALVILPLISTDLNVGWEFPTTALGWVSYVVIRALVGVITYLIFICFDQQGLVNAQDDDRYKAAYEKLFSMRDKNYIPLAPSMYKAKTYGFKAVTLSISSIITAFVVIQCILSYNYSILLAYGLSIIFSVIFGIIQMLKAETYWVEEFPLWVDYHLEQIKETNKDDNSRRKNVQKPRRTGSKEPVRHRGSEHTEHSGN